MRNGKRWEGIHKALGSIEKAFGKGAVMRLGDRDTNESVEVIPTGSLALDAALGTGGLPRGRVVEVYGPESSGKTSLALSAIARVQESGGIAAVVDAEHALDPRWADVLGVDVANLLVSQPDCAEQALEITEILVRSGSVDLVVIDSVAALVPRAEVDGEMGDAHVGLQARLMSQALRKLTAAAHRSNCCVVFINQLRQKIGVTFGSSETTTGGNALKFYASVRLDVRRIATLRAGDRAFGNRVRIKVVKNKLAAPFQQAEVDLLFGQGFNRWGELLDLGVAHGFVTKSGSWYSVDGDSIGQGRERAAAALAERPELAASIERRVREALGLLTPPTREGGEAESPNEVATGSTASNLGDKTQEKDETTAKKRRPRTSRAAARKAA